MLTHKFLTVYGFVGIGIMALLLVLIWFKLVPPGWDIPLFVVAALIWLSRFVLRVLLARKDRESGESKTSP